MRLVIAIIGGLVALAGSVALGWKLNDWTAPDESEALDRWARDAARDQIEHWREVNRSTPRTVDWGTETAGGRR